MFGLLVLLDEAVDIFYVRAYVACQTVVLFFPVVTYSFSYELFYLLFGQQELRHDFLGDLLLFPKNWEVEIVFLPAYFL